MVAYKFDEFVLTADNLLMQNCKVINLSPKESGVLRVLLDNAGSIVSKDKIVQDVWRGGIVSDESLTRCLYMLRKRLSESNDNKFIDTLYGKGYRFMKPVRVVNEEKSDIKIQSKKQHSRFAILPFSMSDYYQSLSIHDKLFDCLSLRGWRSVSFLPALIYSQSGSTEALQTLLNSGNYQYIMYGRELQFDEKRFLRIELVNSSNHAIAAHKMLEVGDCIDRTGEMVRIAIEKMIRKTSSVIELPFSRRSEGSLVLNFQKIRSSHYALSGM